MRISPANAWWRVRLVASSPAKGAGASPRLLFSVPVGVLLAILALAFPVGAMATDSESCPSTQLRLENNSLSLPECRAYELLTPGEKNGQATPTTFGLRVNGEIAPDGNAFDLEAFTTLPGSNVGGSSSFLVRRSAAGWVRTPLVPAAAEQPGEPENLDTHMLFAVGPDWSTVLFADSNDLVTGDADANIGDVFAARQDGSLGWISQGPSGGVGAAPPRPPESLVTVLTDAVGGATQDLGHVVFQAPWGTLLSEDTHTAGSEIYDRIDQRSTKLVGVLPGELVPECGAAFEGAHAEVFGGVTGLEPQTTTAPTVFFESPDPNSIKPAYTGIATCPTETFTPPQLYARINEESTVDVSAPAVGSPDHGLAASELQQAHYVYATPEGTKVFFTSKGALTPDANTAGHTGEDLYEYDLASGNLTDLSSAGIDTDPNGSQVQGLAGISQDGEVVYFVAKGKLTNQATDGQENLYVSNRGQIFYVTTLSNVDSAAWSGVNERLVTPTGSRFLFASVESLTGYANNGYPETYLYNLSDSRLTCVSCGVAGTTAGGGTSGGAHNAGDLTTGGDTVFFDSTDSLTPESTLGSHNVYEWHAGAVALLMAGGENPAERPYSSLITATASGSDVLFATERVLVPQDHDGGERNFYDARTGGGFPQPKTVEPCASTETCRGSGASLSAVTLGSLTPTGSGYVTSPVNTLNTSAATSKVRIVAHSVKGSTISLFVSTPSAGSLSVVGPGVGTVKKAVARAGTYTVKVTLTNGGKALLRKHHRLKLKLRLGFMASSGKASSATITVTVTK
jgi:hypothetical protein